MLEYLRTMLSKEKNQTKQLTLTTIERSNTMDEKQFCTAYLTLELFHLESLLDDVVHYLDDLSFLHSTLSEKEVMDKIDAKFSESDFSLLRGCLKNLAKAIYRHAFARGASSQVKAFESAQDVILSALSSSGGNNNE